MCCRWATEGQRKCGTAWQGCRRWARIAVLAKGWRGWVDVGCAMGSLITCMQQALADAVWQLSADKLSKPPAVQAPIRV